MNAISQYKNESSFPKPYKPRYINVKVDFFNYATKKKIKVFLMLILQVLRLTNLINLTLKN